MSINQLKIGMIHDATKEQDELNKEVVFKLAEAYNGRLFEGQNNAFQVPCAAECGDTSCTKELNCDLIKYTFVDQEDMIRCGNALHMFEPVIGISYDIYHELEPAYFWNKYDQDGENVLDKQEGLN